MTSTKWKKRTLLRWIVIFRRHPFSGLVVFLTGLIVAAWASSSKSSNGQLPFGLTSIYRFEVAHPIFGCILTGSFLVWMLGSKRTTNQVWELLIMSWFLGAITGSFVYAVAAAIASQPHS